ncbi:hypothetical protein MMC29_005520 [Sticta canariensis]|nr:hypothetical protein [Sticta canariensis]
MNAAPTEDRAALLAEIARLETLLSTARDKLQAQTSTASRNELRPLQPAPASRPSHALLLLADSALPLGSFAFSAGLESHLAHNRHTSSPAASSNFPQFLALSLHALATTTLPYLAIAHRHPRLLSRLDAALDAATLCPVARRASLAQGRALLTAWERAFRDADLMAATPSAPAARERGDDGGAREALWIVSAAIRKASAPTQPKSKIHDHDAIASPDSNDDDDDDDDDDEWFTKLAAPQGHFPPLWAVVTRAAGLSSAESVYVFLLGHAKAVAGACVRAGVMGPYQAQALLASAWLKVEIQRVMEGRWRMGKAQGRFGWLGENGEEEEKEGDEEEWMGGVEEAGQGVPAMDLWIGRHELLYSRIFNS